MEAKGRVEGENCRFAVAGRVLGRFSFIGANLSESRQRRVYPRHFFLFSSTSYGVRRKKIVCLHREIDVKTNGDGSLTERPNRETIWLLLVSR